MPWGSPEELKVINIGLPEGAIKISEFDIVNQLKSIWNNTLANGGIHLDDQEHLQKMRWELGERFRLEVSSKKSELFNSEAHPLVEAVPYEFGAAIEDLDTETLLICLIPDRTTSWPPTLFEKGRFPRELIGRSLAILFNSGKESNETSRHLVRQA